MRVCSQPALPITSPLPPSLPLPLLNHCPPCHAGCHPPPSRQGKASRQTTSIFRRDDLVCSMSRAQGGLPGLPLCHLCALSNFQLVHPDGSKLHARPPCKSCNQTRSMQRRPSPPLSLPPRYGGRTMTQDHGREPGPWPWPASHSSREFGHIIVGPGLSNGRPSGVDK